jgi:hypothetical protein
MEWAEGAEGGAGAALAAFTARNAPEGLFLRYCRGRLGRVPARLGLGLAGAATLGMLNDPLLGLAAALSLGAGEAADGAILRLALRRGADQRPIPPWQIRLAVAGAAIHALSIAFAVTLLWGMGRDGAAGFLAGVFLAGAALDAGVTLRHFRPAAALRLGVLAATAVVELMAQSLHLARGGQGFDAGRGYDLVASLMLALITAMILRHVIAMQDRRVADARTILTDQVRLERARQALDAAHAETRRLALVARNASDGVVIYRTDGRVDWVNDTFSRITGFAASEVVGRFIEEVIPTPDPGQEALVALNRARREKRACRGEFVVTSRAGRDVWLETSLTPVPGRGGEPTLMIAVERDITEAKAREAQLARARADAEAAAQAKARFLATMSHELRTPMNGVIGTAELLAETPLDAEQRLYVETLVDSGRALLTIINDVLDLSRLQAGATVLAREPVDVSACVAGAAALLRPTVRGKGLALAVDLPATGGPLVLGDAGRLRQILLNLIGNAIKFTEAGSVTVTLACRQDGAGIGLRIAVADTGIGIPPDRHEAVFESFAQADDTIGRRYGGTGLGLAISRRLAREMGGDITLASTPDAGSTFTLALTLAPAPAEAVPPADHRGAATPGPAGADILLVEDNRTNALIVGRMLAAAGFGLRHVADGQAAVEAFRARRPDLVLMDLSMPRMNGFDALAALRAMEDAKARAPCPVIALTASGVEEDRAACRAAGFDGFAEKPVVRGALLGEIARCLAARPAATAAGAPGAGGGPTRSGPARVPPGEAPGPAGACAPAGPGVEGEPRAPAAAPAAPPAAAGPPFTGSPVTRPHAKAGPPVRDGSAIHAGPPVQAGPPVLSQPPEAATVPAAPASGAPATATAPRRARA